MELAHHPMRLELTIVTMMMGNDYFPALAKDQRRPEIPLG
jgi:hypothetical protein